MTKPHPLKGPNRLKLGVFSTNADGGLAITDVPERWLASWQDNLTAAQIADRAGLEFVLPIARWKGFGGTNRCASGRSRPSPGRRGSRRRPSGSACS